MSGKPGGRALALVAVLLLVVACGEYPLTDMRSVPGLVKRTVPQGATLVKRSEPTRKEGGIRAQWELAIDMTWDAYDLWVRDQLRKDFSAGPGTSSPLVFRKVLPADVVTLQIERFSTSAPLRVRVSFSADPF